MPPSYRNCLLFVFLPLLAILLQTHQSTSNSTRFWVDCPNITNYTSNSTFQSNLNVLLTSLPAAAASSGFYNDTVGQPPSQVRGLALCRGDVSSDVCRACLDEAAQDITNLCPRGARSTVCYDECLLRYSTENFFSSVDTSFVPIWFVNPLNATNQQAFATLLGNLVDELTTEARDSPDLFAAKSANATGLKTLYGLVQCTRDLSPGDCYRCLRLLVNYIPNCCDGKEGARLYLQSCCVRFESFPFYNLFAVMARQPPPALLPSPPPPPPANSTLINGGKSNNSRRTLLFILIPAVAAVVLFLAAIFIYYCRKKKSVTPKRKHVQRLEHQNKQEITSVESLLFDLQVIRIATDNFSETNKLGGGGFGSVYKGTLENGEQIAVKRLARSSEQGLVELKNEVVLVAKLQHRNLVKLLGCCMEPNEELLVYEYLPNTSLDKFLFDPIKREQLDWAVRFKIIKGISRGLLYLHEDSRLKIIHRDLKAGNILLDENMNPKISDFGIAKLFGVDETHKNTIRIAGTYGYMAPEYAIHGLFSIKSDVYSYGVLVLEILTGLKNSIYQGSGNYVHLVDHVWRHWHQRKALQVIDQKLMDHCEAQEVLKCLHIGLLCVQEDETQRPSMASVIHMLNSHSVSLPTLSAPAALLDQNGSEMN